MCFTGDVTRDGFHGGSAALILKINIVDSLLKIHRDHGICENNLNLKPIRSVRQQKNHGGFHVSINLIQQPIIFVEYDWLLNQINADVLFESLQQ